MFDIISLALLLAALAGLWDLKTTEVPDEIPAIMIVSGLAYWLIVASISGNIQPLIISLSAGTILLAAGLLLYRKGQWGGADAWILAAIGYMIPLLGDSIFIFSYLTNFFIVSAVYMIVYAILLGLRNRHVFPLFLNDIRKNKKILLLPFAFLAFFLAITYFFVSLGYRVRILPVVEMFLVLLFLTIFWRYGKVIEQHVFKKRIPVSRLKAGDVLEEMNWVGLTKQQAAAMKRKKKFVTIKEGVRFVPVFFLSLVVTLLYGNVLFLLLGI